MTHVETAKEIDLVAADWVARLDRGALSPEDDRALDTWLAGDSRRAGAFARARAVSLYSERAKALGEDFDPRKFETATHTRNPVMATRRGILWGGSAAAAVSALVTAGVAYSTRGEEYSTKRGQMKVIALSDGSVVSLNTQSHIKVLFTSERRTVHLDEGEALFDVAHDAVRPFIVYAGETLVSAMATSFSVQKLADSPVQVLVRMGFVDIHPRFHAAETVRLGANMRAVAAQADQPQLVKVATVTEAPADVERALAWREGRIAFEGETLGKAVLELQRYSDTRIIIDDPAIAREEITGLFQANDPVGFAQAVASSFDLHVQVGDKQVLLYR